MMFWCTELIVFLLFCWFSREADLSARRSFMKDRMLVSHGDTLAVQLEAFEDDKETAQAINKRQQVMISYSHRDKVVVFHSVIFA